MPISKFIKAEMGSAELNRINVAYAKALRMLDLVDRGDPVTENVAKEVVDVVTSGVTDPQEIARIAVRHFRCSIPTVPVYFWRDR
jgi:hypothetical protein